MATLNLFRKYGHTCITNTRKSGDVFLAQRLLGNRNNQLSRLNHVSIRLLVLLGLGSEDIENHIDRPVVHRELFKPIVFLTRGWSMDGRPIVWIRYLPRRREYAPGLQHIRRVHVG